MRRTLFPAVVTANVLLAHLYSQMETSTGAIHSSQLVPALFVTSLAAAWLAERFFPLNRSRAEPGERRADWVFFGLTAVADTLVVTAVQGASLTPWLPESWQPSQWHSTPVGLRVLLALALWEFVAYWIHRVGHSNSAMWRLHALHHAPTRLTVLNNFRLHPIELLLKHGLALSTLALCGFGAQTLLLVAVLKNTIVLFQHANADLRHGWLNGWLSTNTAHRWHHSVKPEEGHANFGTALLLWDRVFGTLHVAPAEQEASRLGLFDPVHYPTHQVCRALLAPWCWRRCTTPCPVPMKPETAAVPH